MEKEKATKKKNSSIIIMLLAVLLIAAGVGLIVTGNNKDFWNGKDKEEEQVDDQGDEEDDIPDRARVQYGVSEDEIQELLDETKAKDFPEETWVVGSVEIIGHDENNEKLLVSYGEVHEDLTIIFKQTIVTNINDELSVELPGWIEGERDLTVYNFIMDVEEDEEVEDDDESDDYDEVGETDETGSPEFEVPDLDDEELSGPELEVNE